MQNNYRYVCTITNIDYIEGLLVLIDSLKKVQSKYGITILVPHNNTSLYNTINYMYSCDCFVKTVLLEYNNNNQTCFFESSQWKDTFFKLNATGLTEYKKIVLLDIDMLILKNIDDLFNYPHMSAAPSGMAKSPETYRNLNSGLVVFEPSEQEKNKLIDLIPIAKEKRKQLKLDAGDQDVFHLYCEDWMQNESLHLPEYYNALWRCVALLSSKEVFNGYSKIRVVHFIGKEKPWNYTIKDLPHMFYVAYKEKSLARLKSYFTFRKHLKKVRKQYGKFYFNK